MIVPEFDAKEILIKHGLRFPYRMKLNEPTEYKGKFPVVLKVSSRNIIHKTEAGAVMLDIKDMNELGVKFNEMRRKFPEEEIYAEEMYPRGIEIIVGLIRDNIFGKLLMLGIGGFYAELIKDVTFKKIPVDRFDIDDMLVELRYSSIFWGYRNLKTSKEILYELLLKISQLGIELEFEQIDFNPIFLYENSYIIIDSKMVV